MFERGKGPTNNKMMKVNEEGVMLSVFEVGNAPHQFSIEELKEILKFFEKPADKEVIDVVEPNPKRGPGRPRGTGKKTDPTGEVSSPGTK